jgi:ABC-type Mn2+/Zn2+ transport system ATPase subunit
VILHSVQVENYKGIRGPWCVELDPLSPNLFEGPNGVGKSTFVDAIQLCLLESHNTSGESAEAMRPRETALAPSISVVFSHAGTVYRISKTFLDSPKALLERMRADGVYDTIAKGKAADEQVREIVHGQPTKAKDRPGERMGLLSVLFSPQGKQDLPALSGDALTDIRQMLGAQVAGTGGGGFEQSVGKKYLSLWTPGGKPKKGKLTETQAALVTARHDRENCAALMEQVAALESSARDGRSRSQETLEQLRIAKAEYDPAEAVAQQVLGLRARRDPAVSRQDAANARYKQIRAEIDRIVETNQKKRSWEEALPGLEKAEAEAKQLLDKRTLEAGAAQQALELANQPTPEIQQIAERIERAGAFVQLDSERNAIRARLDRAEGAAKRRDALESEIAALSAPDLETWQAIQSAGRDFDEAALRVEALALRLEISAETELTANVATGEPAGEARLKAGQTFSARGEGALTVVMPGIATIRVTGPSGDAAQWRAKEDKAEALLGTLLEPFGVSTWRALEDRVQHRDRLAPDLAGAKAEYAAALGSDRLDDLQDHDRTLAFTHDEVVAKEPSWAQKLPDLGALRADATELKLKWEGAQKQARADWQDAERLRSAAEAQAVSAAETRSASEAGIGEAKRTLAELETDGLTIAARQDQLAERRRECESADEVLREIDSMLATLPADAPERAAAIRERIAGLEMAIQSAREAYQQDEAAARAILLQGPYTNLTSAEERVRQLEHDEAAETLRLNAIRKLKTAVEEAKAKALAGIAEPVETRATALLERISGRPLARVQLGDGMALRSIQPEGCSGNAPVDQMSAGEQEQIYFATRLALAEVLSEKERQVLVLDDPLVNTDTDRLARVLALIAKKSERLQFVILTCHPGRYIELPKAVSRSMDQLTSALAGATEAQP